MTTSHGNYEIDDSPERLDFERILCMLRTSYWWPQAAGEDKAKAAASGARIVLAAYHEGTLVGYMRVVGDGVTFGWICDVIVDEAHRGQGLGRALVKAAMEHPETSQTRRWLLATRDAHGVYAELGFNAIDSPEPWMIRGSLLPE